MNIASPALVIIVIFGVLFFGTLLGLILMGLIFKLLIWFLPEESLPYSCPYCGHEMTVKDSSTIRCHGCTKFLWFGGGRLRKGVNPIGVVIALLWVVGCPLVIVWSFQRLSEMGIVERLFYSGFAVVFVYMVLRSAWKFMRKDGDASGKESECP